jgi:hypothetical protein
MGTSGKHLPYHTIHRIVELAEEGVEVSEIARSLSLARDTVRGHVRRAKALPPTFSDPIVGHGVEDINRDRKKLFAKAKEGDPEAILELANTYRVTGFWAAGTGTVISRHGFRATECMVPR